MDKEQIGIPKLRFPGFTDPWEQRRLGDYLSIPTKEPITDINELKLMTLKLNLEGITLSANRETLKLGATKYYKRHEGQLLYGKQNFFHGSIALIPKEAEGYATSGDVPALDISNVNSKYLVDYISRPSYFKAKEALATGTGSKRIHEKTLLNFKIAVPSLEEQNVISDFITNYTNLIALHQRKLEHLKQQKNGLLQKMFPKNGESVPDVRFPGFTDPWEQRRLGEYYEFKNGLNKGKEFFGDGTPIVNFVDVFHNRGLISRALGGRVQLTPKEISNYEVKKGDLFFTRTSETIEEIGYPSVMLDNPHNTVFSGFVLRGRCVEESDPLENIFKKYVFFTDTFRQEMMKKSSMTTRALTSGIALKSMLFRFPVSRVEQRKIGELITKLDSLIALYQRKLEHLELLKKGLLQQMFV